jgi:cell division protein FtsW (lipid II flippase)
LNSAIGINFFKRQMLYGILGFITILCIHLYNRGTILHYFYYYFLLVIVAAGLYHLEGSGTLDLRSGNRKTNRKHL